MLCACSKTLAWLCQHGGSHSCAQKSKQRGEQVWTSADWLRHFDEEERLFCPYLPAAVADRIRADHARFRGQLRAHGRVDMLEMRDHAALEDEWATVLVASRPKRKR